MAWYDTGTVSVTNGSTTVTGSGTNFVAGVQIGEAFYGPDGRIYEIQAIVSSTSLTLADVYLGATQSGQAYKIVPTQSLVADLTGQVITLINDFQTVADEAGEGKFSDGSAASPAITFTQDQDTGFYSAGANQLGAATGGVMRWLLSSTAFTVNVPITGTAVQSSETDTTDGKLVTTGGARTAVSSGYGGYYDPTSGINIDSVSAGFVGLVQDDSAGTWPITPYGAFVWIDTQALYKGVAVLQRAIYGYKKTGNPTFVKSYRRIRSNDGTGWSAWQQEQPEYGSNANGEFVRFADGTQICRHTLNLTGGGGVTIAATWTFPAAFIDTPAISPILAAAPAAGTRERSYWQGTGASVVNINCSLNVNWPASTSESHLVTAIGRWF